MPYSNPTLIERHSYCSCGLTVAPSSSTTLISRVIGSGSLSIDNLGTCGPHYSSLASRISTRVSSLLPFPYARILSSRGFGLSGPLTAGQRLSLYLFLLCQLSTLCQQMKLGRQSQALDCGSSLRILSLGRKRRISAYIEVDTYTYLPSPVLQRSLYPGPSNSSRVSIYCRDCPPSREVALQQPIPLTRVSRSADRVRKIANRERTPCSRTDGPSLAPVWFFWF
ncbi:hypothetical protein GGR52DRAFT_221477 [Hypoxylon sp. FL1284]|nr:hypothetical protein GGR52DRAFT_221477 [Hypoxylon sp. FL1284]